MNRDVVAPVKGITKALDTGIKLARRLSRFTDPNNTAQALRITASAKQLQRDLEESARAISDAYQSGAGEVFDGVITETYSGRLKEIRIQLIDQINEVQAFDEDEPETFNENAFTDLQRQAGQVAAECRNVFNSVRDQMFQADLHRYKLGRDDRHQLSSFRSPASFWEPVEPILSPLSTNEPAFKGKASIREPVKPKSPWMIESPARSTVPTNTLPGSPPASHDDDSSHFIPQEIISHRLSANEDFLERRRQSRIAFQQKLRSSTSSSVDDNRVSAMSIDELFFNVPKEGQISTTSSSNERNRVSAMSNLSLMASPTIGPRSPVSPDDGGGSRTSGSGYDTLMTRQRSQGRASQGSRTSQSGSIMQEPRAERSDSQASQESIFGLRAAPLSPPLSEARSSGTWTALATTLQTPDFGQGVEPGIEVVSRIDHENMPMLASENHAYHQPTPTASIKSTDYPMRHDSSFYKFGGFCEGARAMVRGESGFRIVKRPSGHYSATVSARCIKCSYEVGWNDVEKDNKLDRLGIYGNSGIRWRQRFISKCHVKTNSVEDPLYACIFCVELGTTIEPHDASIFFSVSALFRHLAKHTLPLPSVAGFTTIYGLQPPEVVDFDIHITFSEPKPSPYSMVELSSKVATRPSAHAAVTFHPKNNRTDSRDPDGNAVLHFAAGARIVGITFPDQFNAQWCVGYHNGEKGSFPASAITLEMPNNESVLMSQSTLVAFVRWDFKPKDVKDGGWLKLSKGEKVTSVGFNYQDQWCWSGQNSKGKWGLFPRVFVENLQEASSISSSPGSVRSGLRIGSFPIQLGRKKSSRQEVPKLQGGPQRLEHQPGLEVVSNRSHRASSSIGDGRGLPSSP